MNMPARGETVILRGGFEKGGVKIARKKTNVEHSTFNLKNAPKSGWGCERGCKHWGGGFELLTKSQAIRIWIEGV